MRRSYRRPRVRRSPRRTRVELLLGRFLEIGQTWRRRADATRWRVRQIHRRDCMVELTDGAGAAICIPFERLRAEWKWIATHPTAPEARAALILTEDPA